MSDTKANEASSASSKGKDNKQSTGLFRRFIAFLSTSGSLTVGIILLILLLLLMAWGTFVESEYGSAVSRFIVYNNPWFHLLIALLALNVAVSILLRFPWKRRHIPFLIAHVGILLLLFGCFLTLRFSQEAQMTLAEGTVGRVAIKPDEQQFEITSISHSSEPQSSQDAASSISIPFSPGPFSWQDYEYSNWIKDGKRYKKILWYAMQSVPRNAGEIEFDDARFNDIQVEVLDYYAHSRVKPVPSFDMNILWNKTVQTVSELGESQVVPRNWERVSINVQQGGGVHASMSQQERVTYRLAESLEELTAFRESRPQGGIPSGRWGEIALYYGGRHFWVSADQLIALEADQRLPIEGSPLEIGNVQFTEREMQIRFSVFARSGQTETMRLLPNYPELNQHARTLGVFGSYWFDPQRTMGYSPYGDPYLQRLAAQRLDFMQGQDKKLYYRLWSRQQIVADGIVPDRQGTNPLSIKLAPYTPDEVTITVERFVPQDVQGGQIVPAYASQGEYHDRRAKLRVVLDGKEYTFWIRANPPTVEPFPPDLDQIRYIYGNQRTFCVEFNCEAVDLGFGILLKKFEKRTEPGTKIPSHYSSLVDYVVPEDPKNQLAIADRSTWFSHQPQDFRAVPNGEDVLISMNRPGFYRPSSRTLNSSASSDSTSSDSTSSSSAGYGYRIYQSSYRGPYFPDQSGFRELYDGAIFPWETRPRESISMSTFSVNSDPGRGCKYLGSFLTVLGMVMFIWRRRNQR